MSFNCYNDIRASMHECQIYGFNLQNSTGGYVATETGSEFFFKTESIFSSNQQNGITHKIHVA